MFCAMVKTTGINEEVVPDCGYFSINPSEKILDKESESEFMLKFHPLECDGHIDRILLLCLPPGNNLDFFNQKNMKTFQFQFL